MVIASFFLYLFHPKHCQNGRYFFLIRLRFDSTSWVPECFFVDIVENKVFSAFSDLLCADHKKSDMKNGNTVLYINEQQLLQFCKLKVIIG